MYRNEEPINSWNAAGALSFSLFISSFMYMCVYVYVCIFFISQENGTVHYI